MVWLTGINPDLVECKLDSGVTIIFRRGQPPLIDTGTTDLECPSLDPADQSTLTDNYLTLGLNLYICSDQNFSIGSQNLDSGKKWILYATSGTAAKYVSHQMLVNQRLRRELVAR